MAEAVFTISADITPQIDERELQRQAQALAGQLNNILSKQIDKVSIAPARGSFRPFEQEVDKAKGVIDKLQESIGGLPRTLGNVAKTGRSAFLKFTDAINVTRREIVGFGGGIRDSIRATNLFENALDGIRQAGGAISELPSTFEDLVSQVRSGTSAIDQAASRGNQLAQLFQPLQQQGEAARTEFVDIAQSLDSLTRAFTQFATSSGKIDATRNDFDLLGKEVNDLEKPFFRVQALLNDAGLSSSVFGQKLRATFAGAAGDPEELAKALVLLRDETQKTAGPLGLLNQILGKVTAEERAAAKAARLELNASLVELGRGDQVQGLQKIAAQFALIRQGATDFATGLNQARTEVGSGLSALQTRISAFAQSAKAEFAGLALQIVQTNLGQKLNQSLGNIGSFLSKNLTEPLKSGIATLKTEASRLGKDITDGLGKGLSAGKSFVVNAAKSLGTSLVSTIKSLLKISSPSLVFFAIGKDIAAGLAKGIGAGIGLVTNALGALTKSAADFAKSAVTVTGVALAGLGATALHAGIEFNTLQQVINATLPVLVGSEQASDALLVKINELNDSSPFARASFLELTRVLAGFGVEAEKITPLIDAIQQTVAATGGGEQDLLELGQAFARIQSQGRLSLEVLQSFSSRGVDAIGILAQQFGKTQSEIREMISGGLVPADQAIDALTKGLKTKFDGATEAVAKNLPGALDRIRAKLRDAGAALTKAFVNPEGGGALVTFLNQISTSLSHITKNILPLLEPVLNAVAGALTTIGEKVQTFVTSIQGGEVADFAGQFGSLLPVLAGLAGFFPQLLSFIPVVGPIIAGLGGPFTALALVIGVLAVKSEEFRNSLAPLLDAFGSLFSAIGPIVQNVLPKLEALFVSIVQAAAPFIASVISKLSEILPVVGDALGGLANGLKPIVEALGRLLKALDPALTLIKNIAIIILSQLGPAFEFIGGVIAGVVDFITELVTKFKQGINIIIKGINLLIKGYNSLPGFLRGDKIQEIDLLPLSEETEKNLEKLKNAAKDVTKLQEEQAKAAADSAKAIEDNYNAASKAVETASAKMSGAIDSLKQSLQSIEQAINPIFEASKSFKSATEAVASAQTKFSESSANLVQINKDYARALEDVISPVNELAVAQRNLTRIQNGLRDLTREEIRLGQENLKIQQDIADLQGEEAAEDRAALARAEERAKINLNKARQAEIDLLNELNGTEKISINLAGLSLDQIRAKLAAARASSKARKGEREETAQEIADKKTSARLDVEDATAGVEEAKEARIQFEADTLEKINANKEKIRDNDERILEIANDKADQILEEESAIKRIARIREGETAQRETILGFEKQIKDATNQIKLDSQAIATATDNAKTAALTLQLKEAEIQGNVKEVARLQRLIWQEKVFDLDNVQPKTLTAIQGQINKASELLTTYQNITKELEKAQRVQAAAELLKNFGKELTDAEARFRGFSLGFAEGAPVSPQQIQALNREKTTLVNSLRTTLAAGVATKDGQPFNFTPAQLDFIVKKALTTPTSDLRKVLQEIFKNLGVQVPGFAMGYAPGDLVHSGLNNGVGLARMFEYGKEAVLPLTRQFDLARVVRNPAVLPKILDALPRWSRPAAAEATSDVSTGDLAAIARSTRQSGGPANADVYEKKAQREFASTIGASVKAAVMEAIAESGGIGGDDVDINILPSTANERLIAREVKRQLDKRTGKW